MAWSRLLSARVVVRIDGFETPNGLELAAGAVRLPYLLTEMVTYRFDADFPVEAWLKLFHAAAYNAWWEVRHAQASRAHAFLLATAWDDDMMVGTVTVQSDGVNFAYIDDVVVHPDYRSRGIGSMLIRQVLDRVAPLRLDFVQLTPIPGRESFFSRFGFVAHPGVIMELPRAQPSQGGADAQEPERSAERQQP